MLTDFPAALAAPQIDAEYICEQEPRAVYLRDEPEIEQGVSFKNYEIATTS